MGRAIGFQQSGPRRHTAPAWTAWVVTALVLSCPAFVGNAVGQSNSIRHSPAEVVQKYLMLDNKGARLDAGSLDTLAPYVGWKEEPSWGKIVVIDGFSVPDDYRKWDIVNSLEVIIPVEFRILGAVYLETAGFVSDPSVEQVRVRVKAMNNRWRIIDPMLPPHVGQRRMMNFVRQAMQEETEETRRASLAALQNELRKAK